MTLSSNDRDTLLHRALRLEYLTVGWNVIEGFVAIGSGIAAGSIALVGFGLDSFIEVTSAVALIWRLKKTGSPDEELAAERLALKIVAVSFFLLSAYVAYESIKALCLREAPKESFIGIGLSILSSIVMPWVGFAKRKTAKGLNSKALAADAVETMVCAWLSLILLLGLGLNALWGWWWADPLAGLVMVGFIVKEGWEALEESNESHEDQ